MGYTFNSEVLLERPLMANLATLDVDGPRNAPVWYIWEEDALWMLGSEDGSSVRRLRVDPRCAVEIVEFNREAGILLHLGLRGRATIEPMYRPRFERLLDRYLSPDRSQWNAWFIENVARIDASEGRLIRLVPQTRFTNNVSYFRTGPELAWSDGTLLP